MFKQVSSSVLSLINIVQVLPVSTAPVERSFSKMKVILKDKTSESSDGGKLGNIVIKADFDASKVNDVFATKARKLKL